MTDWLTFHFHLRLNELMRDILLSLFGILLMVSNAWGFCIYKEAFFFFSFPVTLNNLIDSLVNWKWHISKWFSDFYCLPLSTPTSEMFCLYFSWKYSHHKVSKKRKPRSNTTFLENSSFFFFNSSLRRTKQKASSPSSEILLMNEEPCEFSFSL